MFNGYRAKVGVALVILSSATLWRIAVHGATPILPAGVTHAPSSSIPLSEAMSVALARDATASPNDPLDAKILALQDKVRTDGPASGALEQLGWAFVEKARISGDHGYYQIAERCARAMNEGRADAPEADLLEGHTLHALHRFAEAESVAARLVTTRGSPLDYALYGDILLDLGSIDEAVAVYQRMMQRRPDARAYSRVAEVRLITGDLVGAQDAMRTAARAVSPRDREAFAWIWARLALLDLQSGNLEQARAAAQTAIAAAPESPVAELAYGRILLAAGECAEAVLTLERSAAATPLTDTMRALADAYSGAGRELDAQRTLAELASGGSSVDPRGVSVWMAETGRDPALALALAESELARRHDVYTYDALAIATVAAGHIEEARLSMTKALAAGTQDPRLWYHAGIIAAAAHESEEAREWFLKARSTEQMLLPSQRRDLAERLAATSASNSSDRLKIARLTGEQVRLNDVQSPPTAATDAVRRDRRSSSPEAGDGTKQGDL